MAFIHDRHECLTGCQEHSPWSPGTDLQMDFIMVYGMDETTAERIRVFRNHGYVVHLMTGCAWGDYRDYLDGEWDGADHWDESQCDRSGRPILHGVRSPYLCPTPSFGRYLLEKLKPAVDAGVEAIHLEEPEFWDAGGYSPAFRRAWEEAFGEPWQPPESSCGNRYRSSVLKASLYRRLLSEVGAGLKAYAKEQGRSLSFYVATHSLINYSQWKILSPESSLLDIPAADGFIAQVWTGTSRAGNVWQGRYAERTFETAFLEYGVLRELSRSTGKRLWFLHDPVEDNPEYTWESFRENYLATVTASLMVPDVFRYEAAPWPDRIFHGVYPRKGRVGESGLLPGSEMEGARPIPASYAELICTLIRTLGDMDQPDGGFEPEDPRIGLLVADSALYQRGFPDDVPRTGDGVEGMNRLLFSLKEREQAGEDVRREILSLMSRIAGDPNLYHDYVASGAFPHFFGLAMPLVKAGIPLRPVQLDNLLRVPDTLSPFSALILSEEWMKPGDPRQHELLADWVRRGGTLLLVGDGSDPYHAVPGWWNTAGRAFRHSAQHLCALLGLPADPPEGVYAAGAGKVAVLPVSPARLTLSAEASGRYLSWVLRHAAPGFEPRGSFLMKRGPYRIAAVMRETAPAEPLRLRGRFADLFSRDYDLVTEKVIRPGETALLFDLDTLSPEALRPVASTARLDSLSEEEDGYRVSCRTAEGVRIRMLLKLPRRPLRAEAADENGRPAEPETYCWDEATRTLFLSFPARSRMLTVLLPTA